MRKLTKGAVALGVGTALLLGGAGTFAYWNQTVTAGAGTVTAGNLELTVGEGTWTDRDGNIIDINTYRIVPGDRLVLKQKLDLTVEGDNLAAKLSSTVPDKGSFTNGNLSVTDGGLTNAEGKPIDKLFITTTKGVVDISYFDFWETVGGRDNVNAQVDVNKILEYNLEQVARP